ncbi:MAG: hypothetical protein PUB22_02410 [Clostridiales bacterium]|nr:hypothetical protein [Clostridiales bacterium]
MSSRTNIIVLRLKEIIYTLIFLAFAIFLVYLMIHMFKDSEEPSLNTSSLYKPGIYTTEMSLGNHTVNVEVTVDENHINGICFTNLSDSVTAMYPLMEPAMENLESQILSAQNLEDISYDEGSKYTSSALLAVIEETLAKAKK